ncbi:hypothetical protein FACS1894180_5310 [Bacteroidia bacterium]|nr:hypothetical protein FACS1894180_5310 [Bacteroidia bacterium]
MEKIIEKQQYELPVIEIVELAKPFAGEEDEDDLPSGSPTDTGGI